MRKFRIGNDIPIIWRLVDKATLEPLELSDKEVVVHVVSRFGAEPITDFVAGGNYISFTFKAENQDALGVYDLKATIKAADGAQTWTVDDCGCFELVGRSVCADICPDKVVDSTSYVEFAQLSSKVLNPATGELELLDDKFPLELHFIVDTSAELESEEGFLWFKDDPAWYNDKVREYFFNSGEVFTDPSKIKVLIGYRIGDIDSEAIEYQEQRSFSECSLGVFQAGRIPDDDRFIDMIAIMGVVADGMFAQGVDEESMFFYNYAAYPEYPGQSIAYVYNESLEEEKTVATLPVTAAITSDWKLELSFPSGTDVEAILSHKVVQVAVSGVIEATGVLVSNFFRSCATSQSAYGVPISLSFYISNGAITNVFYSFGGPVVINPFEVVKETNGNTVTFKVAGIDNIQRLAARNGKSLLLQLYNNGNPEIPIAVNRDAGGMLRFATFVHNANTWITGVSDSYCKGTVDVDPTNTEYPITVNMEFVPNNAEPISWSRLQGLKLSDKLEPGKLYRITDYHTVSEEKDTSVADHYFDVVVLALTENKLSEEAWATHSERDTEGYFNDSEIESWKIWYCLSNDLSRFSWASLAAGKGVIYRMIDEYGNDLPYDFKNILYKLPEPLLDVQVNAYGAYFTGKLTRDSSLDNVTNNIQYYGWRYAITSGPSYSGIVYTKTSDISTDTIFYSESYSITDVVKILSVTEDAYTFGGASDDSLTGSCYDNIIKSYRNAGKQHLNRIWFGNSCYSNSFGNYCYSNSFGNYCYSNSFGDGCNGNSFGDDCNSNSFGNNCYSNSFGNNCNSNSFGNNCYSNSFGNNCDSNSFGDGCNGNSFGDGCNGNSFGDGCNGNSFGDDCYSNSFGNGCSYNAVGINMHTGYFSNITLENDVKYVVFQCTVSSDDGYASNIRVKAGVKGSSATKKYITVDKRYDDQALVPQTIVAVNSNGEIKMYCEADLVE